MIHFAPIDLLARLELSPQWTPHLVQSDNEVGMYMYDFIPRLPYIELENNDLQ